MSRKPATALSGTSTERNTTVSRMRASPTTTAMYLGSAAASLSFVSMFIAVVSRDIGVDAVLLAESLPPRHACSETRSLVPSDAGPLLGVTDTTVMSPASF